MSTISARLDRLPLSSYHYRLLGLLGVGLFFDGFDMFLLSGVIAAMVKTGFATTQAVAHLVAASFLGLFLGTIVAGVLCDRYGRRTLFVWSMLVYSLGSIACAIAPGYSLVLIARFIAAIGIGGEVVAVYTYFGEVIPPKKRGTWMAILYLINTFSLPIATFVGMLVIPTGDEGWRWMFAIAGVPAFFAYLIRRNMPESPRWYAANGHIEEADRYVSKIEAEIERKTGQKLPPAAASGAAEALSREKQPFQVLFQGVLFKRTILSVIIYVSLSIIVYSFITWLPTIFVKQGINIAKSMAFTTIMLIGNPVGGLVAILVSDRLSRKSSTIILSLLCSIIAVTYAFTTNITIIVILGFFFAAFTSALCCIAWWTYVPEMYPTAVRARGTGFGSSLGRLATALSPYMVVALTGLYGFSSVLIVMAALYVLMAVIIAALGAETKGRSLEDINENTNEPALTGIKAVNA